MTDLPALTAAQRDEVQALVRAASRQDGVGPVSERGLLALEHGPGEVRHLLAYDDSADDRGGQLRGLVGYAQLAGEPGDDPEAELVVAPAARRTGAGSALLDRLPPDVRIWAHGGLDVAAAFGRAKGLAPVRDLHVLGRPVQGGDDRAPVPDTIEEIGLPEGFEVRRFEPGRDEAEWLRVNAAAFAHHPEQGRWTRSDLAERLQADWFDPQGLLLVVPSGKPGVVAAFHWTKVHPPGGVPPRLSIHGDGQEVGEVYVLGVDPAWQGRGLARPTTMLGLWHLARERGVSDVILYVDGDNAPALAVYRKLGFADRSLDRMYARAQ